MSASQSSSAQQQQSTSSNIQGGSGAGSIAGNGNAVQTGGAGAGSATISGITGNVTTNDPSIALDAITAAGDAIKAVLGNNAALTTQVAQGAASQGDANSALIQQVLSQEQQLAAYQGTNGGLGAQQASTSQSQYVIFGVIALAALGILAFLFRK